MRISEIFFSIEGEGPFTGRPTLFIRVFGCNFTCSGFSNPNGGEIFFSKDMAITKDSFTVGCDSAYSWHPSFKSKAKDYTIDELVVEIQKYMKPNRYNNPILCFTGGEPMLYQEEIAEILLKLDDTKIDALIETNASIPVKECLLDDALPYNSKYITFANAPKLSNSGESYEKRVNLEAINSQFDFDHYYKFVTDGSEKDLKEIDDLLNLYASRGSKDISLDEVEENLEYLKSITWLMPVGSTKQQQELIQRKVAQICLEHGYNFCARVHVWVFDNELGT